MTNTVNKKAIEKRITSLKGQGTKMQDKIQVLIVDCVKFMAENEGDTTLITKLYHALPNMVRRATFKAYLEAVAPVYFTQKESKSGGKIKVFKKRKGVEEIYDWNTLGSTPFHAFEAAKGDSEADPLTVEELQKKIHTYMKTLKTKNEGNKKVVSFIDALESQIDTLAA